MGITLQDIEVMLGVPVDGLLVIRKANLEWQVVCRELLGHEPLVIPNSNKSILAGVRLKYKWLDARFPTPLVADAGDEVVQQYARYHLLVWIWALLFMDKSVHRVSVLPLQFLNPINNVRRYSWGSATLAWLYRHLCSASKKDAMRCRLEEHSCWCNYGPMQGSHKYALLRGRPYRHCTQGPLPFDNDGRERDSDESEYYAGLRREWDFCVNESNALQDDLVRLGAPLVDRSSLTLPWRNMHQYEHAVTK
ncbi:serine/threonine-protein phosphatase 7 long form homolog [Castanea sativa]|uniref:serine/threonine-protein phosphatase 7 long form homolog n=1 Tax=Castanea sativa TaxID=21020 RepID=UPI003F64DFB4